MDLPWSVKNKNKGRIISMDIVIYEGMILKG